MSENSHKDRFVVPTSVGPKRDKPPEESGTGCQPVESCRPTKVGTTDSESLFQETHERRRALFAKEMRQNTSVIVSVCCLFVFILAGRWLAAELLDNTLPRIRWFVFFYWSAFATALMLGSAFLADENAAHTTNFLLRLPASRREIFFTKIKSQALSLAVWCVIAIALTAVLTVPARIEWRIPPHTWDPRDCCTVALWLPLAYSLAVSFSILLDKAIAAFLGALATTAGVCATSTYLGFRCMEWLHPDSPVKLRQAQIVSNLLLLLVLGLSVFLAWRLFARKEGR